MLVISIYDATQGLFGDETFKDEKGDWELFDRHANCKQPREVSNIDNTDIKKLLQALLQTSKLRLCGHTIAPTPSNVRLLHGYS